MAHLNSFTGTSGASTTATATFTVPAGATYCLVTVGMRGGDNGETTLTGITVGAQAATLDVANLRRFDSFQAVEAGYILAANMPSGALTATATRGVARDGMSITVSFFDDAAQQAPVVLLNGNSAGGDPFATVIATVDAVLLDFIITSSSNAFAPTAAGQSSVAGSIISGESLQYNNSIRTVTAGANAMSWSTAGNTSRTSHIVLGVEAGASISATTTGSSTSSANEADFVTGGLTTLLTLLGDTWVAAGATFDAQRQAIIDGFAAATSPATGFNLQVRDNEVVGSVVRTSDTAVTITWTAAAGYDISAQEVVTPTVPAAALVTSNNAVVSSPTFTIDPFTVTVDFYLSSVLDTTAQVKCRVPNGNSTALEYSVNSDFTASATTSTVTPISGDDFVATFDLTGLTANTQYYYRAVESGLADTKNGKFRTMQPAGTPQNILMAFSGDASVGNDSNTFVNVRNSGADFFMNMGDIHYADITTNTESAYWTEYKTLLGLTNQSALYREMPLKYVWDDHDYGANDSDGSNPTKVSAAAAYRTYIPNAGLAQASGSIHQAWTHGRVRFIMLDTRYNRATNTLLGATQKAWLLAELTSIAANANIVLTVVSAGVPWIATGVTDSWSDASAERTEISDRIWSEGLQDKICFVCADAHMIAHDDGTNNTFDTSNRAGWPIYQSAPMGRAGSVKGGPYTGTTFSGDTDGQYSTMQITDTGSLLTVLVTGLDKNDATLYTHSFSISTANTSVTDKLFSAPGVPVLNKTVDYVLFETFGGSPVSQGTLTTNGVDGEFTLTGLLAQSGTGWLLVKDQADDTQGGLKLVTVV